MRSLGVNFGVGELVAGTTIVAIYSPSNNQFVSVKIFSSNGMFIKELTAQSFSEGKHSLVIESDKLPQGFYHIEINKEGSRSLLKFIKM
jgi:hypothetical protein